MRRPPEAVEKTPEAVEKTPEAVEKTPSRSRNAMTGGGSIANHSSSSRSDYIIH